uniref:sporulation initiation factor Spo0A C-terminal domain-containing protein n=1 Tax=Faecalibacillus faecis TaxID=1982628 RepID=UPI00386E0013
TNDSLQAIKLVEEYIPDVVILDLDLSNGRGNGLEFLKNLKDLSFSAKPYVLVTTNISSSTTQNFTKDLGADFIFYKHQKDYSEKKAIDFLKMMQPLFFNNQRQDDLSDNSIKTPAQTNQRLRRLISIELDSVGINPKSVGYKYLIEAILIAITDMQSNIPTLVANRYGKTPASVERGMQNAISRAWRTTDIDELLCHYTAKIDPNRGIPTLTEFIYYYANKVENME